jgi:hypothetical protein
MREGREGEAGTEAPDRIAPEEAGFSIAPVAPARATPEGLVRKPRGKAVKSVKPAKTETSAIGRTPRQLLIPGTLDHAFHLVGGREVAISLTRLGAYTSREFAEFIRLWDDLTPVEQAEPGLLERLCLCIGLHPSEYFGRLAALAYKRNFDVAHFAAAAAAPLVVQEATKRMKGERGFKDREMLLKLTGHLETRGPLVQVNQNSDNRSVTVNQTGPTFEELTSKVSELVRGESGKEAIEGEVIDISPLQLPDTSG